VAKGYFPTKHFQDFLAERKRSDLIRDVTTVHNLLRLELCCDTSSCNINLQINFDWFSYSNKFNLY